MIKVIYNKVCGRCVQSEPLTSGMVGQPIHFEYSHDFDGLTLTAVFTNGKTTVDMLNPGNQCVIPHEVLDTVGTLVKVGIYATKGNELVIPTIYAHIGVVIKGADPSGDVSADPTLPVWSQIQGMIGNLNALETQAKDNLVAAINEAAQSGSGDGLSKTEKNLILTLFKNAMYTGNMTDTVTALENMWSGSGGGEEIVTYTITNTLSNVTSNNSATSATAGSSYSATLTANDGYTINTVTVLMGGVDVTDSVYSNGSITIGSVTGNVSITATAVEASSAANWENGVAYTFTELVANESVRETDGSFITYDGYTRTGYIPCYGAGWIAVDEKATIYGAFYDTNKNFVKGFRIYGPSGYMTVPENAAYFACCASTGLTYTITPYRREEATWEDGVPYTLTFIENSYVDSENGTIIDYNGWKRTDYLNCVGASKITVAKKSPYGAFYNVDKVKMVGWTNRTEIDVPDGACYFIVSGSNADMDAQTIIPTA